MRCHQAIDWKIGGTMKTNIIILFYVCIMLLLTAAYQCFTGIRGKGSGPFVLRRTQGKPREDASHHPMINKMFFDAGWEITLQQYNKMRWIALVMLTMAIAYNYFHSTKLPMMIAIILTCYWVTMPVLKWGKKDSLFVIGLRYLQGIHNKKKDKEIYRILIQLKNIAITQEEKPYSADYIINQLVKFAHITKDGFIKFLMYYNMGREDEAYQGFVRFVPTKMGSEVGSILLKLDKLLPIEMVEQINMVKERNRENHITEKHRKQNRVSDIIYLPIIIPVFILFLNFIMITLWIPKIEGLMSFL